MEKAPSSVEKKNAPKQRIKHDSLPPLQDWLNNILIVHHQGTLLNKRSAIDRLFK